MKRSFDFRPWLKPALTCILGLILIFRPGSLTAALARAIGFLIALVGAGKMVGFFSEKKQSRDFWKLCGSIVLLVLGFAILRNPVSLEKQVVRVIGILLLLAAIRGYIDPLAAHEQISSTLLCIAGVVLLLMPVAVSRLVVIVCGIVVLLIGAGMIVDLLHGSGDSGCTGGNGEVIDAR